MYHSTGAVHFFSIPLIFWTYPAIYNSAILQQIIPNHSVREPALLVALFVLFAAFGAGKVNAEEVLKGKNPKIVSTKILKESGTETYKSKGLLEGQDNLKFIGVIGEYFFFISMDNSATYVVKYSDLHFLELR